MATKLPFADISPPTESTLWELRKAHLKAIPEVCVERPRLVTRYHTQNELFAKDKISILDKAKAYRFALERRTPIVKHGSFIDKNQRRFSVADVSPFAGSTTSKFKGVPVYPELFGLLLWPELLVVRRRQNNPFAITDQDIAELNLEIFPSWMDKTILEITRSRLFEHHQTLSGKSYYAPEIDHNLQMVFFMCSKMMCISHTIPRFEDVLNYGMKEMVRQAAERLNHAQTSNAREFYSAMIEVLTGIIGFTHNLANEAFRLAAIEPRAEQKSRLLEIAEIYKRIPEEPAQNFREGLTAIWVCWIAIHLENPNIGMSLGRLDQVLFSLYKRDIARGSLTSAQGIELVCHFWLKLGDHVPLAMESGELLFGGSGANQAITLGGVDASGHDAVNDLTYIMLRATEIMCLRDPNVNVRYHSKVNSDNYLRRICDVNLNTGATPAIHNDNAVIKALTAKGYSLSQARDYGIVGCVEPVSAGRTYGHNAAIIINLMSALELALFNGRHRNTGLDQLISLETGYVGEFQTINEFLDAFCQQVLWLIDTATFLNNELGRVHQDFYPTPILSALFEGPMEKGLDVVQGGATLNSSGIAIVGFADVIDSLTAIEDVVFATHARDRLPFSRLIEAITKNFEGYTPLHTRLLKIKKFGSEDRRVDEKAQWLANFLDDSVGMKSNYRGGPYRVSYWSMTIHAGLGKILAATPNGRKAGQNLASGITPVSGATPYLTATLNSVARIPAKFLSGGIALNIKYTPEGSKSPKTLGNFAAIVEGYFDDLKGTRDGGMEIQFNIVSRQHLENAIKNPEAFPDLLVRVSGYTAYFKDLNPQMQREIIERTEYHLSTGTIGRAAHA